MRAGTHHTEESKLEIKRAKDRKWSKNRDYVLLANERKAERAKLPARELPARRRCLGCGWVFLSKNCGNRFCHNCRGGDLDTNPEGGLFGDALSLDELSSDSFSSAESFHDPSI